MRNKGSGRGAGKTFPYKEKRILLAEDNDLNAEIAQTLLGSYDFSGGTQEERKGSAEELSEKAGWVL